MTQPFRLPDPRRLTPQKKALIIVAVRQRRMSRAFALSAYDLTEEEFRSWEQRYAAHGVDGLRVSVRRLPAVTP